MAYGTMTGGSDRVYPRAEEGEYVLRLAGVKVVQKPKWKSDEKEPNFRFTFVTSRAVDPETQEPYYINLDMRTAYNNGDNPTYHTKMSHFIRGAFGRFLTDAEYFALSGDEPHPPFERLYGHEFKAYVDREVKADGQVFNNIKVGPKRPTNSYLDYNQVMNSFTAWWLDEKPKREARAAEYAAKQGSGNYTGKVENGATIDELDDPFAE